MTTSVKTFIADSNYLILEGLRKVLSDSGIDVVGVATRSEELREALLACRPEVLLIDYSSEHFSLIDALESMKVLPSLRVIGIVHECHVSSVQRLIDAGLNGHLMNDCDREEIIDSIHACARGDKFFCGKVLDKINAEKGQETDHGCDPVSISERELEILQLIAEGLTTKQIAARLHLSFHTVMTHRKNMMGKLGLNNTAGLIVYAVKENLISPNRFLFSSEAKTT